MPAGGATGLRKKNDKKMKSLTLLIIVTSLIISAMQKDDFPVAEISNGILSGKLYLPDTEKGYYRGTRFDWAGVIPSLRFSGHEYFGQWFEKYSPTIHDAIMGPVDGFTPIDFNGAKPGDTFLMIGIGMLVKPDDKPWTFAREYEVADHGKWEVKTGREQVRFIHTLKSSDYSYVYEKEVKLVKNSPVMVISHRLKNNGKKSLETPVYNHNFFVIDGQPVGPGYSATWPFRVSGTFRDGPGMVVFNENGFTLNRNIGKSETIYTAGLTGFGTSSKDYDIRLENSTTGAGVRITCDKPLLKMVFWACPTTFCPEPYITVKADPGKEFSWDITYEFYNITK